MSGRYGHQPRRPAHAQERPAPSPAMIRRGWQDAVGFARRACADAMAAGDEQHQVTGRPEATLLKLTGSMAGLTPENFPVASWSAQVQAGAFLMLAKAFCHSAMGPEARTACAGFLAAGASLLDQLTADLRADESQVWRGQLGERD